MICIIANKQAHFYDQILIRKEVFINEQQVPIDEEYDEFDKYATQFIVYDNELAVGTARFRSIDNKGKIERVCVLKDYRTKGVGRLLMTTIENYAKSLKDINKLVLGAQLTALKFYEKLGYQAFGEIYLDANIDHQSMEKKLNY